MILIARAPIRISLLGEGIGAPACDERWGGLTIGATINHYAYTILTPGYADELRITSADYRTFFRGSTGDGLADDDLNLPKAIARYFNLRDGLTVFLASQIPPGVGLGSSNSVAVSMIKALAFWCGLDLNPEEVADLACHIWVEKLGLSAGKQNHYVSAFGGLNCITFSRSGVTVEPLRLPIGTHEALESNLMLFYGRLSSSSSTIFQRQERGSQQGDGETKLQLSVIRELGLEIRAALERGDLESFGALLHSSWVEECKLPGNEAATPFLAQCYRVARENGALGGKISGSDDGGFLMLYCPVERQDGVTEALEAMGLERFPFAFERQGVEVMQAITWPRPQTPSVFPFVNGRSQESRMGFFAAPVMGQNQPTI